ncbi:MAG: RsmE family RNA methyltransferase, partial [Cyanobacteria bacterium P01_H01_bin.130]
MGRRTGPGLPQRILIDPDQLQGDRLTLSPDQRHYLSRVLRLSLGDQFVAMFSDPVAPLAADPPGRWWLAALELEGARLVAAVAEPNNAVPLTVLVAIAKGGGFDEVLRQVTELGAAVIVPVLTERTVVVPGANKIKRWQRIVMEAAEQCERSPLPQLLDPLPWSEALQLAWLSPSEQAIRCICVARSSGKSERSLLAVLQQDMPRQFPTDHHPWVVAIGPEGGRTDDEKKTAIAAGFEPVSLGDRILRAVTAAVTATAIAAAV